MLIKRRRDILKKYTTPGEKIAFTGRKTVAKENHITAKAANKDVLSYNYSYPLHRDYKRPRIFNPYFSFSPREQIQSDLVDVHLLAPYNNGIKFLLVCIDICTRKCWVEPLKAKNARLVVEAFRRIFNKMGDNPPKKILFDRGTEFTNNSVVALCREKNIQIVHPNSQMKAAFAERVNRTLQSLIYRYMSEKQTNNYEDVLQQLVESYNKRGHRSLNEMSPEDAENPINLGKLRNILFHNRGETILKGRKMRPEFKIGDMVRIKTEGRTFARGYNETFSKEYFQVAEISHRLPIITYKLKSMNTDEYIKGEFYSAEMQLVQGDVFKVEKILKQRVRNGRRQYLIKWLDFDDRHNSWVPASHLKKGG